MPLYTYRCPKGHQFDRIVHVDKRDDLQPCPEYGSTHIAADHLVTYKCEQLSERVGIELNAKCFPGADNWRRK